MDGLFPALQPLLNTHADLSIRIALWIGLWAIGLRVLRIRPGAFQYAAWVASLAAIALFPLVEWSNPRTIPVDRLTITFDTSAPTQSPSLAAQAPAST